MYIADAPKTTLLNIKTAISTTACLLLEKADKKPIWLPSGADRPRDDHMPYYGAYIGAETDNHVPGDEFGCQCGVGHEV